MAMIAFYAGLIVGIFVGCLLMSLFPFFLPNEAATDIRQEKPLEL
jgi:hypothetical protein